MKGRFAVLLLASASLLLAASARAGEPAPAAERVLLEIGGEKFRVGDFELFLKQINPQMEFARLPAGEQQHWLDEYVRQKLLARRARAAGLERDPEVRAQVEFFVERVLAQAYQEKELQGIAVSDDELVAHYRVHAGAFRTAPRVLVQHFLYRTAEKAEAARARLVAGADYAELAAEKRRDEAIVLVERGWITRELLPTELAELAFALSVGAVSEPARTGYGWHVLRVEAREEGRQKELDAVREQVLERVRQEKAAALFERLLQEARAEHRVRLHAAALER